MKSSISQYMMSGASKVFANINLIGIICPYATSLDDIMALCAITRISMERFRLIAKACTANLVRAYLARHFGLGAEFISCLQADNLFVTGGAILHALRGDGAPPGSDVDIPITLAHLQAFPRIWYFLRRFVGGTVRVAQRGYSPEYYDKTQMYGNTGLTMVINFTRKCCDGCGFVYPPCGAYGSRGSHLCTNCNVGQTKTATVQLLVLEYWLNEAGVLETGAPEWDHPAYGNTEGVEPSEFRPADADDTKYKHDWMARTFDIDICRNAYTGTNKLSVPFPAAVRARTATHTTGPPVSDGKLTIGDVVCVQNFEILNYHRRSLKMIRRGYAMTNYKIPSAVALPIRMSYMDNPQMVADFGAVGGTDMWLSFTAEIAKWPQIKIMYLSVDDTIIIACPECGGPNCQG